MNDRYLFRAKRKNWKQLPKEMWWVEGYLYGIWERRYILWGMINDVPDMIEVDPSTICQCTGLKYKNGKLIWENDVLLQKTTEKHWCQWECMGVVKYGEHDWNVSEYGFTSIGFYIEPIVRNGNIKKSLVA